MTLFPQVAKRARAELDNVIGTDRLPTFEDRDSLPYINALVKEVFRWYTVVPTGWFLFQLTNHAIKQLDFQQLSLIAVRRMTSTKVTIFLKAV
jgi:hypothetical protein